jgi:fucose 4-O-acetylase-like acetyltransferase
MAYKKWIDIAKGIGIFLVIVGHSHCPPFLQTIIYSFHMPLFFFLSGYTFHYDKYKLNKCAFVMNKFYRLVVPYFFANFLILLILSLKDSLTMNPLKMPIPVTRS